MEDRCFVIQPYCRTYDKRYNDIYEPAIKSAGFVPRRADKVISHGNYPTQIAREIKNSFVCLADVSLDNPDVWDEIGHAQSLKKPVIYICDESRENTERPMCVRSEAILFYLTESLSDFVELETGIVRALKAVKRDHARRQGISSPLMIAALRDRQRHSIEMAANARRARRAGYS